MSGDSLSDAPSRHELHEDLPDGAASMELLARAQAGDARALHELLERYQERLRRIVRIQLAGSPLRRLHDSMDVVQGTFLAALPRINDLRPRSPAGLLRWLALIATNELRDTHGRETAEKRDLGRARPLEAADGTAAESGVTDPARAAEGAELRERLDAEVVELPEDQRRVVLLRDYCGESWERIAEELAREPGATRQLHQRAWIRLRQRLRPWLERERREE